MGRFSNNWYNNFIKNAQLLDEYYSDLSTLSEKESKDLAFKTTKYNLQHELLNLGNYDVIINLSNNKVFGAI